MLPAAIDLDRHLPVPQDFTCARDNDMWLDAHFSDVSRMKRIKLQEDPNLMFYSRLF